MFQPPSPAGLAEREGAAVANRIVLAIPVISGGFSAVGIRGSPHFSVSSYGSDGLCIFVLLWHIQCPSISWIPELIGFWIWWRDFNWFRKKHKTSSYSGRLKTPRNPGIFIDIYPHFQNQNRNPLVLESPMFPTCDHDCAYHLIQ